MNLAGILKKSSFLSKGIQASEPVSGAIASKLVKSPAKDVFVKNQIDISNIAKKFREGVIAPFDDWQDILPADGEGGSMFLARSLKKYSEQIKDMTSNQAEQFVRLILGESHLTVLKDSASRNTDVKSFIELLENKVGKSIEKMLIR